MAIAGDVIIKLAADFAEFAKGMDESVKKLGEFGKQTETLSGRINGVIDAVKGLAVVGLIVEGVKAVTEEIDRLQEKFGTLAEQGQKLGASFDQFERLRLAAMAGGGGVDQLVDTMGRLKTITDQALQGNKATIDALNRLGVTILDNTGKVRSQVEINQRVAEAFERMPASIEKTRLEFALFGKAGEEVDKTLKTLATSQDELSQKFQTFGLGTTIAELKEMEEKSKLAREQFDLMVASVILPIKVTALNAINAAMQDILKSVKEAEQFSDNWLVGFLRSRGSLDGRYDPGSMNVVPVSPFEAAVTDLGKLKKSYADVQAQIASGDVGIHTMERLKTEAEATAKQIETVQARLDKLNAAAGAGAERRAPQPPVLPTVTVAGARDGSNPSVVGGGGGGGGGKSDADDIDAIIKRYKAMQEAANQASSAVRANQAADIDDLARVVQVKQETQDILAKIELHKTVPDDLKKALEDAIGAAKQAQADTQRTIQYNTQADAIQRRLGDGTAAFARVLRDLNRELDTGRLHQDAYNRALKEATESTALAALAAKRYDDDLGSLVAGFEAAAQTYARANDLYAAGGKTFSAVTGAMDEGLDALAGRSTKTFGQIASDFALMLAKIAEQAAVSQVFKLIFGSAIGGASGNLSGVGVPGAAGMDAFLSAGGGAGSGAGGGILSGLLSFVGSAFGGGRQGGGDVWPGRWYNVGEHGTEKFVPTVAGRIQPAGAGGPVNVYNMAPGVDIDANKRSDGGLDVTVRAVRRALTRDIVRGGNDFASSLERTYRVNRGAGH